MLDDDLLDLLYVQPRPDFQPHPQEAEFQEVGGDEYDDLGASDWLPEEEGVPTLDQLFIYYQILQRAPVYGLYVWQWLLLSLALSISLVIVTISHVYNRARGQETHPEGPDGAQVTSVDDFQTPISLDRGSPSRLVMALLRDQLTAAQSAMNRKRLWPGFPRLCPPTGVQGNNTEEDSSLSSNSHSIVGRECGVEGEGSETGDVGSTTQADRYGFGWRGMSGVNGGTLDQRPTMIGGGLLPGGMPYAKEGGNSPEATASAEFWSPLQQLSLLATSALPVSGKPGVQAKGRWPIWSSPFLGMDLTRLFGIQLGRGLGKCSTTNGGQKKEGARKKKDGLNSSKIESFKKSAPLFYKGLKSIAGLAKFRPGADLASRIQQRRKSLSNVRSNQALGATDNSTVSLEIATSDLLQGDFSKIQVKYSNLTDKALAQNAKKSNPLNLQGDVSSSFDLHIPPVPTSQRASKHRLVNQTRERCQKKLHGKPHQPTFHDKNVPVPALGGNNHGIGGEEVQIVSKPDTTLYASIDNPQRSLRQNTIDEAGGILSEMGSVSEMSVGSFGVKGISQLIELSQNKKGYLPKPHKLSRARSPLSSDKSLKHRTEKRNSKSRRKIVEAEKNLQNRHVKKSESVKKYGKLKHSSLNWQKALAQSSSITISTDKLATLTGATMSSNRHRDFKLKKKTTYTSSPEGIVKAALKEMQHQQSHKNLQEKLHTRPDEASSLYKYHKHLKSFKNGDHRDGDYRKEIQDEDYLKKSYCNGNNDQERDEIVERSENYGDEEGHKYRHKQGALHLEPVLPSLPTTQVAHENTLNASKHIHRLEAISEASAELEAIISSLLTASSSDCISSEQIAHLEISDKVESKHKRPAHAITPQGKNTAVGYDERPLSDIRPPFPSPQQNTACRSTKPCARRTRQSIWQSNEKPKNGQSHIFPPISQITDKSQLLQGGASACMLDPASKYHPHRVETEHCLGPLRSKRGFSSHSAIKRDSYKLSQKHINEPLTQSQHKREPCKIHEKLNQKQSTEVSRLSHANIKDHQNNWSPCAVKTISISTLASDSYNIQHRLHMTVSLTSVLENTENKYKSRMKTSSPDMCFSSVADRNLTQALKESVSDNPNRVAHISLTTHSQKRSGSVPIQGDLNACKNMSTTQSPTKDEIDNSTRGNLKKETGKRRGTQEELHLQNERKQTSETSCEGFSLDRCKLKRAASSSKHTQFEEGNKRSPPSMHNAVEKFGPIGSPPSNGFHEAVASNQKGYPGATQQDQKSPLISFIAPMQIKSKDKGLMKSPVSDKKTASLHSAYKNCKQISPMPFQQQKNYMVGQPRFSSRSVFLTQLEHCKLMHYSLGENEKEPEEPKTSAVVVEEPEPAPRSKFPATFLCSPRACRLHGSDVRLCENRPVQQTITHQQYTMKELQLAGYSFFKDDLFGGDTTASSRCNGASWGKGHKIAPKSHADLKSKKSNKVSSKAFPKKHFQTHFLPVKKTTMSDSKDMESRVNSNKLPQSEQESKQSPTNKGKFRSQWNQKRHVQPNLTAQVHANLPTSSTAIRPPDLSVKEPKALSKRELMNEIKKKIRLRVQSPKTEKNNDNETDEVKKPFVGWMKKTATEAELSNQRGKPSRFGGSRRQVWQKVKDNSTRKYSRDRPLVSKDAQQQLQDPENSQGVSYQRKKVAELSPANNRFHFGKPKNMKTGKLEGSAMNLANVEEFLGAVGEVKDFKKIANKEPDKSDCRLDRHDEEVALVTLVSKNHPRRRDEMLHSPVDPQRLTMPKEGGNKPLTASNPQKSWCRLTAKTMISPNKNKQRGTQPLINDNATPRETINQRKENESVGMTAYPFKPIGAGKEKSNLGEISGTQDCDSCSNPSVLNDCDCEKQGLTVGELKIPITTHKVQTEKPISKYNSQCRIKNASFDMDLTAKPLETSKQRKCGPRLRSLARSMRRGSKENLQLKKRENSIKVPESNEKELVGRPRVVHKSRPDKEVLLAPTTSQRENVENDSKVTSPTLMSKEKRRRCFDEPTLTSKAKISVPLSPNERTPALRTKQQAKKPRSPSLFPATEENFFEPERNNTGKSTEPKNQGFEQQPSQGSNMCVVPLTDKVPLPCVPKLEGISGQPPLNALGNSNLFLTCTQVDCKEATPYRKTKLAWTVSPEVTDAALLTGEGRGRKNNVPCSSSKDSFHLRLKSATARKAPGNLKSLTNVRNKNTQRKYMEDRKAYNSNTTKQSDCAGVMEEKASRYPDQRTMTTKSQTASPANTRDAARDRFSPSFCFLDFNEMLSEETENYKLPETMPKMIGCSDVSDKTMPTRNEMELTNKHQKEDRAEKKIPKNASLSHKNSLSLSELGKVKISSIKEKAFLKSEKMNTRPEKQAKLEDQKHIISKLQSYPKKEDNAGCAARQSSGSMPEPVGASDASLGGMETPVECGTSKSGLSELAIAAVSNKGVDKPTDLTRETRLVTLSQPVSDVHRPSTPSMQRNSEAKNGDLNLRSGKDLMYSTNTQHRSEWEAKSAIAATAKHSANKNLERARNKPTLRQQDGEDGEIEGTKSQSQSQSWTVTCSHKTKSVGESITNTLERLIRRRLVSGRSLRTFGASSTSPRPAVSQTTRPEGNRSPGTYSRSSDPALSPARMAIEAANARKFLRKTRPRSPSLSALGRAEEAGYVASAAHHSLRRRWIESPKSPNAVSPALQHGTGKRRSKILFTIDNAE